MKFTVLLPDDQEIRHPTCSLMPLDIQNTLFHVWLRFLASQSTGVSNILILQPHLLLVLNELMAGGMYINAKSIVNLIY